LYQSIRDIINEARQNAYRAINFAMVQAYWNIGRLIVEEEQKGRERAEYGTHLIQNLAGKLTAEFGKGFTQQNLRNFRQFYLTFKLENDKDQIRYTLRSELSWSHYRLIMRLENPKARQYYMNEAAEQNWNVRALERQINSFYYERILASRGAKKVIEEAHQKTKQLEMRPEEFIKDPYVLEFLDLNPDWSYLEKEIEQALIDKLQQFLLELRKGFSFVARQQRISTETSHFYIDLVFYNFILKCFVLIDLKTGKLTHQDVGQMDMYVRMYEDRFKTEGDNPTIGIILCTEKDETIVRYSVLEENQNLFASRYKLYLPTEQELINELEREKALILRTRKDLLKKKKH
jgi:predicted nuclease of restriction endonuclease-like (RecB) superfamily